MNALAAAERALARFDAAAALEVLKALPSDDPDANALRALALTYSQQEFEATETLPLAQGSARYEEVRGILCEHFAARRTLAQKLNLNDVKGEEKWRTLGKPENMIPVQLSACLIVKNEEANLERCLKSLEGVVDEVVIVDTGSTDRTLEIAQAYDAVIGHFPWINDFSAARNESLRLATGSWALWIDADEELAEGSRNAIFEAIIRPHFGGYFVPIVNFMSEENDANQYVHTPVRLFQLRPGVQFEGRIHEQVLPSLKELGLPCATLGSARLNHYGYQPAQMEAKNKLERTVTLLEKEVAESPEDAFQWFNLANAYSVGREYVKAAAAAETAARFLPGDAPYGATTYQIWASSLNLTGQSERALQVIAEAEVKAFAPISVQFEKAHALYRLRQFDLSLSAIQTTMEMPWPPDLTGDIGVKTHKSHVLLGQILTELGRFAEAREALVHALSIDPGFALASFAVAALDRKEGRLVEAERRLQSLGTAPGLAVAADRMRGQIAADNQDWNTAVLAFAAAWEADPNDHDAWLGLTQALERQGSYARLVEACEKYAISHGATADLLTNVGRYLLHQQDVDGAMAKFVEAVNLDPTYANAYFNLGDTLYGSGLYLDAAETYEKGLRLRPEFADGWFVLGNCFARLGYDDGACMAWEKALLFDPAHRAAAENLRIIGEAA